MSKGKTFKQIISPAEGIMTSRLCDLDWKDDPPPGYGNKRLVIVQQRIPRPMTPLKVWRGFNGNFYFEPIKIRSGPMPPLQNFYNSEKHHYDFNSRHSELYLSPDKLQRIPRSLTLNSLPHGRYCQADKKMAHSNLDYYSFPYPPAQNNVKKTHSENNHLEHNRSHTEHRVKFDVVLPRVVEDNSAPNSNSNTPDNCCSYFPYGIYTTRLSSTSPESKSKYPALVYEGTSDAVGSLRMFPGQPSAAAAGSKTKSPTKRAKLCRGNTVVHQTVKDATSNTTIPSINKMFDSTSKKSGVNNSSGKRISYRFKSGKTMQDKLAHNTFALTKLVPVKSDPINCT